MRRRVLVVADNVDAAESVGMILQLAGYQVRCLNDGPSVLQAALTYRPDVVVLDIGLPGTSGYEVAKQLREQPEFKRTPLVAVTGYGQDEDRRRSQEAGFDYHLTKPVDPDALEAFATQARRPSAGARLPGEELASRRCLTGRFCGVDAQQHRRKKPPAIEVFSPHDSYSRGLCTDSSLPLRSTAAGENHHFGKSFFA